MCNTWWLLLAQMAAFVVRDGSSFVVRSDGWLKERSLLTNNPRVLSFTSLEMAITPVGPFCPFRSSAANEMDPRMAKLNTESPEFATEMAKIQVELQSGGMPDPQKLLKLASDMEVTVDEWESLMTRLRLSQDFQTREYAKLTQAHLQSHGVTIDTLISMVRWQSSCMKAMARNTPPPMPPADLDLARLMKQDSNRQPPSMSAMTSAEQITSTPFTGDEAAFDSPNVKEEYEKLCEDHAAIIDMGASYATFDPLGKISFLDEVDKIQERWDVFFTRFSLMGQLNQDFVRQCNGFLKSMGLTEEEYRDLLKKTHTIMREEAERERDNMPP